MKTEAGRKTKIATFVRMLKRGETIHPQGRNQRSAQGRIEEVALPVAQQADLGSGSARRGSPAPFSGWRR